MPCTKLTVSSPVPPPSPLSFFLVLLSLSPSLIHTHHLFPSHLPGWVVLLEVDEILHEPSINFTQSQALVRRFQNGLQNKSENTIIMMVTQLACVKSYALWIYGASVLQTDSVLHLLATVFAYLTNETGVCERWALVNLSITRNGFTKCLLCFCT